VGYKEFQTNFYSMNLRALLQCTIQNKLFGGGKLEAYDENPCLLEKKW
jgi:hypothetical protein